MKKFLFICMALLSLNLAACANSSTGTQESSTSSTSQSSSQTTSSQTHQVIVTIDGADYKATLDDSEASRSLIKQLPLKPSFRDYASGFDEKITDLAQPLGYKDDENENDPQALDIAYWSPDERLVFYYGDVGAYSGIHVLGHFDSKDALKVIRGLSDSSQVSIRLTD